MYKYTKCLLCIVKYFILSLSLNSTYLQPQLRLHPTVMTFLPPSLLPCQVPHRSHTLSPMTTTTAFNQFHFWTLIKFHPISLSYFLSCIHQHLLPLSISSLWLPTAFHFHIPLLKFNCFQIQSNQTSNLRFS